MNIPKYEKRKFSVTTTRIEGWVLNSVDKFLSSNDSEIYT